MRLYRVGDKSAAICETCRAKVTTRMEYRDHAPAGWSVVVPDILVGVCERCERVVTIPHQSTYKINSFREEKPRITNTVAFRVTREIDEALGLVVTTLGGPQQLIMPAVMRYYLAQFSSSETVARLVKAHQEDFQSDGDERSDRRISLKLSLSQLDDVLKAMTRYSITNRSNLFRGVIGLAAADCGISIDHQTSSRSSQIIGNEGSKERLAFLKDLVTTM